MHERTPEPYDEALKRIPMRFYELDPKVFMALTVGELTAFQALNIFILHQQSIPAHIVTTAIYAISAVADRLSTMRAMNANNAAESEGAVTGFQEENIALKGIKTSRDFLRSKRTAAIDIGTLAFASMYPGLAVGLATAKFQATANNLRAEKRIQLARSINRESMS